MNNITDFKTEFLVVGASVAGSLLADKLANFGKTIFTDKYEPGTLMNCGGGMPIDVFSSMKIDIPYLPVEKAVMDLKNASYPFPLNYVIVNRSEFDNALFKKAKKAGADFLRLNYQSHDPNNNTAVFLDQKHKKVIIEYKKIILAYGFHPRREPFFGKKRKEPFGAAVVQIIDCPSPFNNDLYFQILTGSPGYTWVFPMLDNKINIGTGTLTTSDFSRKAFSDFKKQYGIAGKIIVKGGGVFPIKTPIIIQKGSVYLFGDAAGMINALNGEGIRHINTMAAKFATALAKGKNMNFFWWSSGTFYYLLTASSVFKVFRIIEKLTRIPLYKISCKYVAKLKKNIGVKSACK